MKLLVTGATGQLGREVCLLLEQRGVEHRGVGSREMDVTDPQAVTAVMDGFRPDAVLHCAAYTAVDKAENEAARCMAVNAGGTALLAEECRRRGAGLLYVSTDYVFPGEGDGFYEVDSPTAPRNIYGRSKLAGEKAVRQTLERYCIVRTSWVFGRYGANFVRTMLRLAESRDEVSVVSDQIGSPTYAPDLASLLIRMALDNCVGLFHATNEGICSRAELAQAVFELAGKSTRVQPVLTRDYPSPAQRPLNSRLSKTSLDACSLPHLPEWQNALERYLKETVSG